MHQLSDFVEELEAIVRDWAPAVEWHQVRCIEASDVDYSEAVPRVSEPKLMTIERFQEPFESALSSGYAWVNLSALGVLDGSLVVALERPRAATAAHRTSVNLSGPARGNVDCRVGKR